MARDWRGVNRLPFTLLGGYLGAGKTTIVNRLLARNDGRRLVVLVNDVGGVNVDAALIARHGGETLELTNGCVCCAIADDLGPALERVRALAAGPTPPDQVVMELSGVAEPTRVAPWANTTGFRLDGIVICADADQIVELAARRFVGDTIRTQLAAADLVLLTKTDLAADDGEVARSFVARLTAAPIVDAGDVEIANVLSVGRSDPRPGSTAGMPRADESRGNMPRADESRGNMPRADMHRDMTIDVGGRSFAELERLVDGLGSDVIRAKGIAGCTDRAHPVEVHVVGARRELRERPDLSLDTATDVLVTISAKSSGEVDAEDR